MKNKLTMLLAAVLTVCTVITVAPTDVKAMAPCSQDIINAANAQIAATTAQYQAAQQAEAAALANLNAVKAAGASQLEITVAANAYTTAQQVTHWNLDQVNNAKLYLKNITDRANIETAIEQSLDQLHNLTNMQASKQEADNAQALANATALRIAEVNKAIAGYQQAVLTTPSLQPQIDQLNAQLVVLQNQLAAQQAVASQKAAAYQNAVAADHYDQYDVNVLNYYWARENSRNHSACCTCDLCRQVKKIDNKCTVVEQNTCK